MDAFIGEIRPMAITYTPQGWILCDGRLLNIAQYNALYAVIGSAFGGDGRTTFAVPNMMGRTPMGLGIASGNAGTDSGPIGTQQGSETVSLNSANQLPAHSHTLTMENLLPSAGTSNFSAVPVANGSWLTRAIKITGPTSASVIPNLTANVQPNTTLHPNTISTTGQGLPHENRQPYLAVGFFICNDGLFPAQS